MERSGQRSYEIEVERTPVIFLSDCQRRGIIIGIHVFFCRSSLLVVPFCHSTDTLIELIGVKQLRREVIASKRIGGSEGDRCEGGGDGDGEIHGANSK